MNLEDIRIFKGGRIDRAILYAASILNHSCETLRGLFRQIIGLQITICIVFGRIHAKLPLSGG